MAFSRITGLLSGAALFLYGMALMGDGLERLSGTRMEALLSRLTGTPFRSVALGAAVTAVIQSSSATSVMAAGFADAGFISLRQACGVVIGAIWGTSATGWIVWLSYREGAAGWGNLLSGGTLAGIVAVTGIALRLFSRREAPRNVGGILMGFVVLMTGIGGMSGAAGGLAEQPWFLSLLSSLTNPAAGMLAGAVFAALVQSASAAVGILQALSVTGTITLKTALPLLMGITIGASVPVLLSVPGAGLQGKRVSLLYLLASVLGVTLCASLFYAANALFRFPLLSLMMDPFSLALANTLFRSALPPLLTPLSDVLEEFVFLLLPERTDAGNAAPRPRSRFTGP